MLPLGLALVCIVLKVWDCQEKYSIISTTIMVERHVRNGCMCVYAWVSVGVGETGEVNNFQKYSAAATIWRNSIVWNVYF